MHTLLAHHLLSPRIHVKSLLRKKKKKDLPCLFSIPYIPSNEESRPDPITP